MQPLGFSVAAESWFPQDGSAWVALLASYLLGAVPFGWVLARVVKGVDLRKTGSGNKGTTNAMRVLGRPLGMVVFALDCGKGWVPAALFADWAIRGAPSGRGLAVACGAAAVVGHVWPVYLRFRGGKAVATGCGALLALDPVVVACGGLAWLATLVVTRYVGLASMVMAAGFCVAAWIRARSADQGLEVFWGTVALAMLVLLRHRANIQRMLRGTEPRMGRTRNPRTGQGSHV